MIKLRFHNPAQIMLLPVLKLDSKQTKGENMKTCSMKNLLAGAVLSGALVSYGAHAELIGGVDFPQGPVSFADAVVSYSPTAGPSVPHQGAFNALGVPNYNGVNNCASQAACSFVSLGQGGSIVLRFLDNLLTGSDTVAADLWIFEVGPDVEKTFVDVSTDGIVWVSVGFVGGATAGVDLDAFGFGLGSSFAYVRLTDDASVGGGGGATPGADIDAVGAISTRRIDAPEPGTLALLGIALAGMFRLRRKN
jgi:hypothetical protein